MIPQEFIRKKQLGAVLTAGEISDFFSGYLDGKVADYQMSAMLMTCYFMGLNTEETVALTNVMQKSGTVFKWQGVPSDLVVDKHSTGGVGDKTSIIILPLCLLEGLYVPMISGRGLGHTGGTVDKLESIPGLSMSLTLEDARRQLKSYGGFFMSQTPEIAPLDKKLYALRDVTSTVASLPLIVSSILSKKLAEGTSGLVVDVKFGSGAFLQEREKAKELARMLKTVAALCDLRVRCVLSSMNSPLGSTAGNALEILECLEVLRGQGPSDTRELSLRLAAEMLVLARPEISVKDAIFRLAGHLDSGRAFEKFSEIVRAQGGRLEEISDSLIPEGCLKQDVVATESGTIFHCNVRALGLAVVALGGGRKSLTDLVDPLVGLTGLKKVGGQVDKGEPLCTVYGKNTEQLQEAESWIRGAYKVGEGPAPDPLISEIL